MSSKYRVTKGFKFHARPQTGAYWLIDWLIENFQFYSLQMQLHNNQQYNSYLGRATKN